MTRGRLLPIPMLAVALALALVLDPGARADDGAPAPLAWEDLSPAEQRILASVEDDWASLAPEARATLHRGAQRWLALTPDERRRVEQRYGAWRELSPAERDRIRERFRQFRTLPPAQQRAARQLFQRFQQLPPAQRERLRERFEAMSPAERRAFVAGASAARQAAGEGRFPAARLVARLRALGRDLPPPARRTLLRELASRDRAGREALIHHLEGLTVEERVAYLSGAEAD